MHRIVSGFFALASLVGCFGDDDDDLFREAAEFQAQVDRVSALFTAVGSEEIDSPFPAATGGPELHSVRAPAVKEVGKPVRYVLTAAIDAPEAVALRFGLDGAGSHLRAALTATEDAGIYLFEFEVTELVPPGNWSGVMALEDADGNVGNPVILRLDALNESVGSVVVLAPHEGATRALAFGGGAAEGWLATGGNDDVVALWDVATGRRIHQMRGHVDWVVDLAFSPDGEVLLSASEDHHVRMWDVASGTLLKTLGEALGPVRAVAFEPGGQRFAAGTRDGFVRIYDRAGVLLRTLDAATPVADMVFNELGALIVGGGPILSAGTVVAYDTTEWTEIRRVALPREVTAVAHDGEVFAGATGLGEIVVARPGPDDTVSVTQLSPPAAVPAGPGILSTISPRDTITSMVFVPNDPNVLLTVTLTGVTTLWDVEQQQIVANVRLGFPALSVAFSSDAIFAAVGAESGATRLADFGAAFEVETTQVAPTR